MTTKSIILLEDCPICIATQSMFIQMATGLVYPLMSSIGGTYMVNIPELNVHFNLVLMYIYLFIVHKSIPLSLL